MMRGSAKSGFTLTEAVISMVLLAMVITGSYAVVTQSSAMILAARNHYVAINIARARFERIRNFAYDQLTTLAETNLVVDDSGNASPNGFFRRTTTIQTNYQPGLTKIEVRTDIRDTRTLLFMSENESVACLFTEYLTR